MNLQQLETFLHVAEHGSFSKAALVLDVAQPALSRQVRALETELRETLLVRTGRGVTLTPAGSRLLEYCQDILHLVSLAKEDLSAHRYEPVGQITVALPPTLARLYTLPLIQAFQEELPRPAWPSPKASRCTWPSGCSPAGPTSPLSTTPSPCPRWRSCRCARNGCVC
jgi:LysR family nitrogen assimilation transcriptional regulator